MARRAGERPPAVVATIGVFDGVHRGHRALIESVVREARARGVRSLVVTFDPHPAAVLARTPAPHLLTGRKLQMRYLTELGVDLVWMLPFSRQLAALEPRAFVEGLLLRYASIAELWVGHDFRFGHDRTGDAAFLRGEGRARGFTVREFPPLLDGDRPLSSTRIRAALAAGEIDEAARLLGHTVLIEGSVVRGRGLGAKLLVPTANLDLAAGQFLPAHGVYAAWAELPGRLVPAVLNIGLRPTLVQDVQPVVEAHLLGFHGDLLGVRLGLHLRRRLRDERKFGGLDELREAISRDLEEGGRWLAAHPPEEPAPPSAVDPLGPAPLKDDLDGKKG